MDRQTDKKQPSKSSERSSACPALCCPFQKDLDEPECVQISRPEAQSETDTKAKTATMGLLLQSVFQRSKNKEPKDVWHLLCPPGDKNAESKVWLKTSLEKFNEREMRYFQWFLQTANNLKDGFKPIRRSRLQHADTLDTADLMLQMYPTNFQVVSRKIIDKINRIKDDDLYTWVLDSLEKLQDAELRNFHWFLQTAVKHKDGFKPIKNSWLEDADRLDTANLMVQTYSRDTKAVAVKILQKVKSTKGKVIPEAEEKGKPSSPAAAEEKELSKVLEHFVKKAPEETVNQLSEALVADGVLKSSDKQIILEKNHTRVNKASCLADIVMEKGTGACKKMVQLLQTIDAPRSSKLGLLSSPFAQQDQSSQEPKSKATSEVKAVCQSAIQNVLALHSGKPYQKPVEDEKEMWQQICPEGDNDANIKQWLKEYLEDLDSREMKYFHWYLYTADKSRDGFKPIKKSRLEHADRLDTVDLMFQTYTTRTKEVARKVLKKINKNTGQDFKDWLLDTLEELGDKEFKYFHWYLHTSNKSKDGFKPIKKCQLEGADILDTVNLMINTYATRTKEVTEKILTKIKNNKEKGLPEVEEQTPSTPSEDKVITRMLNDFVEKVPKETFKQLIEALMNSNTLKSSEKETILQNHTRVNMASCFVDIVMEKGGNASKEVFNRLQGINPHLSSELRLPSNQGYNICKRFFTTKKPKEMTKEQQECWQQICPPGDKDADLKRWLKKTLEDLKNKELKYFHWYLRTSDESKDGFKSIKRYRLKHADRLDTLDLLVQMYPGKVKEITEKILEKIRTNKAQHWILEIFEDMGDLDLKYCQMLLQSADRLKGTSVKRVPVQDGEDAINLMMEMYNSENRETLERALNEIQEASADDLSEAENPENPSSPTALREKKMKNMLLDFIKKVSNETLEQLLKHLVADKVITDTERKSVFEKNHTRVNKASCLVEILKDKGSEACQKMICHVQTMDHPLYSELGSSQSPNFQQELLQFLCLNLKEEGKTKEGGKTGDKERSVEEEGSI